MLVASFSFTCFLDGYGLGFSPLPTGLFWTSSASSSGSMTPEKGFYLKFSLNFNIPFFFTFPALNSTAMNKKFKS